MNAPTKAAATTGAEAVLPAALAPRAEGPRIYNLFPLLVGRVADWTAELELRETGERVKPVRLLPDGRLQVRGAAGERALVADYLL